MSIEIEELGDDGTEAKPHHIVKSLLISDNSLSLMSPNTPGRNNLAKAEQNLGTTKVEENNVRTAERFISKWDIITRKKMLFQSGHEEVRNYMDAVQHLHRHMKHLSAGGSSTELIRPQQLMKMSMARLQKEFHKILSSNSEPIHPDRWSSTRPSLHSSTEDSIASTNRSYDNPDGSSASSSSNRPSTDRIHEYNMVPLDAVVNLRSIAHNMAKSGYARECLQIFVLIRKSVVEESFYNLGVEKARLNDVRKMDWQLLDEKIKKWIYAAKISIRILFAREKRLCDEVFEGFDKMKDFCFGEIAKDSTARLLAFGEAVAATSRAPEMIFRVLDLYETVNDLVPDIKATYCQDVCRIVPEQADRILVRLGEAVRGILTEFEKALKKENSKVPIAGGTVHPLPRYVMNYLTFLSDHMEYLIKLSIDTPGELPMVLTNTLALDDSPDSPSARISSRFGWIIFFLACKLEEKSDLYEDPALSHLFLMNNLHYIVQKVKGSELKLVMGEEWLKTQRKTVRQCAANYEKAAWKKVLSSLTDEEVQSRSTASSGEALREKLKAFNLAMAEVKTKHGGWVVPDATLREKVAKSIGKKVIPAYNTFLARFKNHFNSQIMYIKYTPEDLQEFFGNMFEGTPRL